MKVRNILLGMAVALIATVPAYAGNSTAGTKIGILTCNSVPGSGVNLLIHSTVDIECKFESTDGSGVERYIGETGIGFGIDINYNLERHLAFTVFAADTARGSHKLAGKYGGAGASATVGVGAGAQVLVGGSNKSVSLQPVIEGSTGVGVSAGVTYLFLQAK
ncbi:MAG: DUF992 domain-containing protein [Mariprofundus sp.]|nr:DUF992 domain-containing protein [Mariprofundus sp.]